MFVKRLIALAFACLSLNAFGQGDFSVEQRPGGEAAFTWTAESGAVHFWQLSPDLGITDDWLYMPEIIAGDDMIKERCVMVADSSSLFGRSISVASTLNQEQAENTDFDLDGFTNIQELMSLTSDPLRLDTNGDGIADGFDDEDMDGLPDGFEQVVADYSDTDQFNGPEDITRASLSDILAQTGMVPPSEDPASQQELIFVERQASVSQFRGSSPIRATYRRLWEDSSVVASGTVPSIGDLPSLLDTNVAYPSNPPLLSSRFSTNQKRIFDDSFIAFTNSGISSGSLVKEQRIWLYSQKPCTRYFWACRYSQAGGRSNLSGGRLAVLTTSLGNPISQPFDIVLPRILFESVRSDIFTSIEPIAVYINDEAIIEDDALFVPIGNPSVASTSISARIPENFLAGLSHITVTCEEDDAIQFSSSPTSSSLFSTGRINAPRGTGNGQVTKNTYARLNSNFTLTGPTSRTLVFTFFEDAFPFDEVGEIRQTIQISSAEIGIDLITRDPITGDYEQRGRIIEEAQPMPIVDLDVLDTRLLANGDAEIDVQIKVRDPLSEILPSSADQLQNLSIYFDGVLEESIDNLQSLVTGTPVSIWQLQSSEVLITRTYTVNQARTGTIQIRAEAGLNAAGNQGWDVASVLLTRAGAAEVEMVPNTDFELRLIQEFDDSSIDTIFAKFGTGIESSLVETSTSSREFQGVVSDNGVSKSVTLWMDTMEELDLSAEDILRGWLEVVDGANTFEEAIRWKETTTASQIYQPEVCLDVEGTDNQLVQLPPLRVENVEQGDKSMDGSFEPLLIRVAAEAGTIGQIGTNFTMEIDGVSYPVVLNNNLIPNLTPPPGIEWGYVAENGQPKVFLNTPVAIGSLMPVSAITAGNLSAVLRENATSNSKFTEEWTLIREPRFDLGVTLGGQTSAITSSNPPLAAVSSSVTASGNYSLDDVDIYYDIVFGEYGEVLRTSMETRGLEIKVTNIFDLDPRDWIRKNITPRAKQLGRTPELWVDNELDNVTDGTVALFEGLYSLKRWYVRDDLRLARFDDVLDDAIFGDGDFETVSRELHEARLGAIGDYLDAMATVFEVALTIVNEPADWVLTAVDVIDHYAQGEIVQGTISAAYGAIPFMSGRVRKAGKALSVELTEDVFRILEPAQRALSSLAVKGITRVERMRRLRPFIQAGDISRELVEKLYSAGFLRHLNSPSKVLRSNLEVQLGRKKLKSEIAHHDLVTEFDEDFILIGVDINDGIETGRFLDKEFHKKLHGKGDTGWPGNGGPWNYQWREFFRIADEAGRVPTLDEVIELRDYLRGITADQTQDVFSIPWRYPKP